MIQTFVTKVQVAKNGKNTVAKVNLPPGSVPFKSYLFRIEMEGQEFQTKIWFSDSGASFTVPFQIVRKLELKDQDSVKFKIKK
jgi:hypothetical protein